MITLRNLSTVKICSHDIRFLSKAIRKENSRLENRIVWVKIRKTKNVLFLKYIIYFRENSVIIIVELIRCVLLLFTLGQMLYSYSRMYYAISNTFCICELLRFCNPNLNDFGLPL